VTRMVLVPLRAVAAVQIGRTVAMLHPLRRMAAAMRGVVARLLQLRPVVAGRHLPIGAEYELCFTAEAFYMGMAWTAVDAAAEVRCEVERAEIMSASGSDVLGLPT